VAREDNGGPTHARTGRPVTVGRSEKMSKSKKNVVDPVHIIDTYGADTARLFMLSDSPPDRDLDWTEAGIDGAWRYVNRLWRMVSESPIPLADKEAPVPETLSPAAAKCRRLVHRTIALATEDLNRFHFNKAVARIREMTNALEGLKPEDAGAGFVLREGLETATLLIGPLMPHLAEEMWEALGHDGLLAETPWPEADPALVATETVTLAVQVNGKTRGTVELPKDAEQKAVEEAAFALQTVVAAMGGKAPRKVILVPNRILNVVV
jgi:leucyl-tRNA synthetase